MWSCLLPCPHAPWDDPGLFVWAALASGTWANIMCTEELFLHMKNASPWSLVSCSTHTPASMWTSPGLPIAWRDSQGPATLPSPTLTPPKHWVWDEGHYRHWAFLPADQRIRGKSTSSQNSESRTKQMSFSSTHTHWEVVYYTRADNQHKGLDLPLDRWTMWGFTTATVHTINLCPPHPMQRPLLTSLAHEVGPVIDEMVGEPLRGGWGGEESINFCYSSLHI